MAKLKTVREANGTVSRSKKTIEFTPDFLSDVLSVLESSARLAEYVEITGDNTGRLRAMAVRESIAKLERKHKIKIK